MKKLICFLISVLLLSGLTVCASAYDYGIDERTSLVNDFAGLMYIDDADILNNKLEQISEIYECEVALLTVNSTNGQDITDFADDYYDNNGFGYGINDDGILLVVDMENREYAMTTYGTAISIFNDYNLYILENEFIPYLSEGSYTTAFITYYEKCSEILYSYNNEDSFYSDNYITDDDLYEDEYDYNYSSGNKTGAIEISIFSLQWIGLSIIGGIIIAFVYTYILKAQLKSVHSKASATDYVVEGSVRITRSRDIFLHKNIRKTAKPKSNSSSGGSTTHRSSSGRSHGGSSGKF